MYTHKKSSSDYILIHSTKLRNQHDACDLTCRILVMRIFPKLKKVRSKDRVYLQASSFVRFKHKSLIFFVLLAKKKRN